MAAKKAPKKLSKSKEKPSITISNCNFNVDTKIDSAALAAIQTVAEGLLNLTALFKAQHVRVDSCLRLSFEEEKIVQ